MRYLVGFACVLAALVALPLSASAQAGEEGATSEPNLQEPAPSSEPAPEEPALKLELDEAGVWVVTDWQTLKEMERIERRVRLAGRVGMPISAVTLAVGAILFGVSYGCPDGLFSFSFGPPPPCPPPRERNPGLRIAGSTLMAVGALGMIVSGALVRVRKRELREMQQAHHATQRRVQWDLAQWRLLF
jgi:hypothetical protein